MSSSSRIGKSMTERSAATATTNVRIKNLLNLLGHAPLYPPQEMAL